PGPGGAPCLRPGHSLAEGARRRGPGGVAAAHGLRHRHLLHRRPGRGVVQPGPLRWRPLRPAVQWLGGRPRAVSHDARGGVWRRSPPPGHARYVRPVLGLLRRLLSEGATDARADRAGFSERVRPRRGSVVHTHYTHPGVQGRREARGPGLDVPLGYLHGDGEPRRAPGDLHSHRTRQRPAARRTDRRPGLSRGGDAQGGVRARAGRAGHGGGLVPHGGSWETVIGLETHVQLRTASKMFCSCSAAFGAPPNTNVCPLCLGLPGALPAPNEQALKLAVRAALALSCTVHPRSIFERKNYLYPDLPKVYQIAELEQPLSTNGALSCFSPDRGVVTATIVRLHIEEDAGKSLHDRFPRQT